jgi:hypothetical protein
MTTSEEPDETDPDLEPIRVVENVLSAWRWDAWRDAATRIEGRAGWISLILGLAAAVAAAAAGYALITGDGRLSAIVYSPLVGWGIRAWTRSWIATYRLKAVLAELRPEVVPKLVHDLDDDRLLRLLVHGGALVPELSTRIAAERRDAALALVAYEYDMTKIPPWDYPDAGGGG